ncbi:hypothetical protein [Actinospongicola halichondriae]|uniref:hypothetical protein n=1 Tax=Actinospongicola halichondriae TaxID=3236844 RepID=UPI003D3CE662
MSDSDEVVLENGPESRFVVQAIDAILRADIVSARLALIDAADLVGWAAVAHRLDVVGHALAADAGMTEGSVPDEIDLVPEVIASTLASSTTGTHDLLARWCHGVDDVDALPLDEVWPSLALVAWMVDRAGYPAEVVV